MPSCSVKHCKNFSKKTIEKKLNVTYHKFPNDPQTRQKWILATGKLDWLPNKSSKICSDHFEASSFTHKSSTCTRLSAEAVPTLKLHPVLHKINSRDNNDSFTDDLAPAKCRKVQVTETNENEAVSPNRYGPNVEDIWNKDTETHTNEAVSKSFQQKYIETISNSIAPNIQDTSKEITEVDVNEAVTCKSLQQDIQMENNSYETDVQDSPQKRKLELLVIKSHQKIKKKVLEVKRLRESNRRLSKKVAKMEDIIKDLRDKSITEQTDDQASDAELNSDDDISDEEVLPLKPQQKSKHKPDETVHDFGIKCSNCRGKITGFRYTCVQCVDVELCGACDARGAHADHYVLRIPGTRPKSEIAEVLTQVREALGMVLFSRKTPEINQPDEPEIIKPENIDEEAADPLKDDPNARPHKMNILEQALLGIPLIKEECIEPEQFDHTEKPFETPVIKQEVVDLGAEVIDTSAQTTATDLGNTITVYGHQPGSSSGSTSAKRPRVCPPQPAPAASSSGQVTTVTQDKQKIASQPSSSSGSGFIVMSHAPRNTNTAPAKTSKGNKKKS